MQPNSSSWPARAAGGARARRRVRARERAQGDRPSGTGKALEQRLKNGPADLITVIPTAMEALVKKGRVVAGTVTPFMLAGLGLSVRAGAPKPDISTSTPTRRRCWRRSRSAIRAAAAATYIGEGIAQLGLTEQLKPKTTLTTGGPARSRSSWRGRLRDRHSADQHHGRRAGTDYVGPLPGVSNKPCPSSVGLVDGLEGAGRRAGDDQVHDFAGGRAAAAQKSMEPSSTS